MKEGKALNETDPNHNVRNQIWERLKDDGKFAVNMSLVHRSDDLDMKDPEVKDKLAAYEWFIRKRRDMWIWDKEKEIKS